MIVMTEKKTETSKTKSTQETLSHSHELLLTFSRAAQSIQRARAPQKVYHAVGEQIKSLGGEVFLFTVNDDGQSLTVVYTSYASNLIRRIEKIMGNSLIGYRFELGSNSKYIRTIATGKTIYVQHAMEYVTAMLPADIHVFANQFMNILKIEQGIFAPLRVDNKTLGLMIVSGLFLNEGDIPAMESFAGQIAISLSNLHLVQQLQNELTARKQAEEKSLWQSAALEAAANPIAIIDKNGIIQWVNQAWVTLTGFTKEETIGQNPRIIKSEKHDLAFYKDLWGTILSGKVWHGELINKRKSGSLYYEEQTITPVLDGQGNIINFIAIKIDITERKLREAELSRTKEKLEAANLELQIAFKHERHLAHTDVLTGVNNRRHLFDLAGHEFDVARRYQQPLSVIMFDLDHFKQINDTFGHAIGDQMLESVTQIACAQLRDTDIIGRYGGEEFVIVMPVTSAQQAYLLAERVRTRVSGIRVETTNGPATITLSLGIAEIIHEPQDKLVKNVIRRADEALYIAKRAGRNRTVIFGADK
jgi:diguanylate cyclase (GGDEF)-like protein/PAS domain S-box-containing protein